MTCGCAGTKLLSRRFTTTAHHPARGAIVLVFFSLVFFLLFPKMQCSARENTLIVDSNACSNPQLHAEQPIKWRAALETGIMLMLI